MERLLEALRRNPDAIALAVLCLTLGIGRHMQCARIAWSHVAAPARIHWIFTPMPEPPELPALPPFGR